MEIQTKEAETGLSFAENECRLLAMVDLFARGAREPTAASGYREDLAISQGLHSLHEDMIEELHARLFPDAGKKK